MLPVHNHSEYSALDGYGRPEEIANRIEKLGLPGAFLTDHGTVAGFKPFADEMAKRDLFFGFGMEAYQARVNRKVKPDPIVEMVTDKNGKPRKKTVTPRDGAHLILLAQTKEGLRNLMRLSDEANRTGYYYHPRLDWELLEAYNEGIICTTACMGGLVAQGLKPYWDPEDAEGTDPDTEALGRLHDIFRDRLYIELHTYSDPRQHALNHLLVEQAGFRGIPVVYANDAHYCAPEDWDMHEVLLSMQMGKGIYEEKGDYGAWNDNTTWHPKGDLSIMDEDHVREALDHLPQDVIDEAIRNSDEIMELCKDVQLPEFRLHLPKFEPKVEVENNEIYLLDLMEEGLVKRYGDEDGELPDEVIERAAFEYEAIVDAGLHDYFLIVWDFINFCRRKGIRVGPGRGSAGGSILAYSLGITNVDPLKYGLYFERFWNPGRTKGLPDIDVDIEKFRREEVKEYLKKRYGVDRVLPIGNHIRMQPKSAIDKGAMALWGPKHPHYGALELIKREINKMVDAGQQPDWETIWADEEVAAALQSFRDQDPFGDLFDIAEEMTGRIATYGVHASAVVISDVDLPEFLPCRLAKGEDGDDKVLVTQLEMRGVEEAGFPKFDLLGLKTLDVLQLAVDNAGLPDFDFDDVDFDDLPKSFWKQLEEGNTQGFFQIENGHAARKIAKELKPRSILDLAAIVALNRPGPLRSGMVERYFARRNGAEPIEYSHPILSDILQESYGDFLYQEQVLAYFRKIGYSLGEADEIRKILGKKLVEKMKEEHPRYLERASQHMDVAIAENIWQEIIGFSKYSFNKSHAVAYAIILAHTMYAKWKWPASFLMASIAIINRTNTKDKMDKIGRFIQEGRKLGVDIRPPDINHSEGSISKVGDTIYYGLQEVKWVGPDAAAWIIENRPFDSLEHMQEVLEEGSKAYSKLPKAEKEGIRSPKQRCTGKAVKSLYDSGAFDTLGGRDDLSSIEKAKLEEELLGIALTDGDADLLEEYEDLQGMPMLWDIEKASGNITVAGVVKDVRKTKIRQDAKWRAGEEMARVTIRWKGVEAEFAAFPDQWKTYKFMLRPDVLGRFTLKAGKNGASLRKAEPIE